jgi:translation initiation factor 1
MPDRDLRGRVVYDSAAARPGHCPTCGKRLDRCVCGQARGRAPAPAAASLPRDGVVRLLRDRKQRGGKVVTVIAGLPADQTDRLASELKRLCGTGGTVKQGAVEIQGDHRDRIAEALRSRGFTVKLAGG